VIVAGERIAAIGPSKKAKLARGAHIVDGSGKFLCSAEASSHRRIREGVILVAR
jgi:hypothetical protein